MARKFKEITNEMVNKTSKDLKPEIVLEKNFKNYNFKNLAALFIAIMSFELISVSVIFKFCLAIKLWQLISNWLI